MSNYNVQCLCGYVGEAPDGSEIEERCKELAAIGHLGSIILLSSEECPDCQARLEEDARRDREDFRGADLDYLEAEALK